VGGPYRGWEGEVLRIDVERQRVTVVLPVFAKATAITLQPGQIEPVR
jgi:transcription antitermination factor NusG